MAEDKEKLVKNERQMPKVYVGLHFVDGPAEYQEAQGKAFRVYLNEQTLREMDKSFSGCPVYVGHVDSVDVATIRQADGYVVRSFLNEADGKHWAEFIVVSDEGHDAIRRGWRLSNAYIPEAFAPGGMWNGIRYDKEVTRGTFEHLALVPDPRYAESIVLTPDEFKKFNDEKRADLKRLTNSKEKRSMWDLFKRTKVETSDITPDTIIKLPVSGKEVTFESLVNAADKAEKGEDKAPPAEKPAPEEKETPAEEKAQGEAPEAKGEGKQLANDEHHVAMKDGSTMSVGEMRMRHDKMQDCMNTLAEMAKPKAAAEGEVEEKEVVKKNDEKSEEKKEEKAEEKDATKNDDDTHLDPEKVKGFEAGFGGSSTPPPAPAPEPKPTTNSTHFDALKNAEAAARSRSGMRHTANGIARGKQLFGSN